MRLAHGRIRPQGGHLAGAGYEPTPRIEVACNGEGIVNHTGAYCEVAEPKTLRIGCWGTWPTGSYGMPIV
jgi:hypothetical protein